MVELVVVIVLIGILGAVATARYFDSAGFDAAAYAEQTRTMLRYAPEDRGGPAPAGVRRVRQHSASPSVSTTADLLSGANRVLAPGGANSGSDGHRRQLRAPPTGTARARRTRWPTRCKAPAPPNFFFDALGRPFAAADAIRATPATFAGLVLRITGDGLNRDITVSPETGYVY